MCKPTEEMYRRAATALSAILGSERYPCEHDFLAHRAIDAALLGPDEQLHRTMDAIGVAEDLARQTPVTKLADR